MSAGDRAEQYRLDPQGTRHRWQETRAATLANRAARAKVAAPGNGNVWVQTRRQGQGSRGINGSLRNLFGCLVGQTSRSRKGSSADYIRSLFHRIDPDWVRDHIPIMAPF